MWPRANLINLAVRIPLVMLAAVFVVEAAIMAVFAVTAPEGQNRWLEVVIDSTVLTLTVAPLVYWLIVRPLGAVIEDRSRLLARMFEIQDAERQQIARDLHDEIGQSFTALLVQMRVLEEAPTLEAAKAQARDLRELSDSVYDQIRSLARGLYPTVLDDLGLLEAVRRLVEDYETAHGIRANLQISGEWTNRLDRKVEATAYRIVQESLTNCAKYAQAARVDVTLDRQLHELKVSIADHGQGFDVEKVMHAPQYAAFGITNMRERALLLHGALVVDSRPGRGTTVTLAVPLRS